MKKRIYIIIIFCVILMFGTRSYAKYVLQDNLKLQIYIDKTPPQINVICDGQGESFDSSNFEEIQKRSNDIEIITSDNIEIEKNEYYFNKTSSNFDGKSKTEFSSGCVFYEEGFYKFVVTDISGNKTEIIILIDKTPPEVKVQYFKRGEIIASRKVVAKSVNFASSQIVNELIQENEKQQIMENEVNDIEKSGEEEKNVVINEVVNQENIVNQVVQDEVQEENIESNEKTNEVIEPNVENLKKENNNENFMEQTKENESINLTINLNGPRAISDAFVGNENEFRNALANQAVVIHVRQSIDFSSPIYINYPVTIIAEGASNSLRYWKSGDFIVVQKGGSFCIDSMVIDTNSAGINGITAINIQNGGNVTVKNSSIIDGGLGNTGALVNTGGTLELLSSEFVRCGFGINLQTTGRLIFRSQEGRGNKFYKNVTAVFIDNFSGECNFGQSVSIYDNSQYGICIANSGGNITISSGEYYSNTYAIHAQNIYGSSVNISGGDFYSNRYAIWAGGDVTLSGGAIHNNYHAVVTDPEYLGEFIMTGGSIYSNISYAINHIKTNDGGCTILGGNINGEIYLAQNDNYINTNAKYPVFTVTPSTYYFKRKLVKTNTKNIAQKELANVTLTSKENWYKYVDVQYIVVWQGGNVIVQYKDYYGKTLSTEMINGNIGDTYTTNAKNISGYDLNEVPENAVGKFAQQDIIVVYKYDVVNYAKVSFEDVLSGVVSAKYWYNASENEFSGYGTDFANDTVFQDYGYYKVVVQNGVGLTKELIFVLNKDSIKR